MLEQPRAHVGDDASCKTRVPPLVPDRHDRGENASRCKYAKNGIERLEVLFAERVIDQELQAQRHDDVEQGLDQNSEANECQQPFVGPEEWPDEAIDGREGASRFPCTKDNEILVILIVLDLEHL